MSATLNDSYLVVIHTENDPVFLIDPDAGKSAEITLQHFNFDCMIYKGIMIMFKLFYRSSIFRIIINCVYGISI